MQTVSKPSKIRKNSKVTILIIIIITSCILLLLSSYSGGWTKLSKCLWPSDLIGFRSTIKIKRFFINFYNVMDFVMTINVKTFHKDTRILSNNSIHVILTGTTSVNANTAVITVGTKRK